MSHPHSHDSFSKHSLNQLRNELTSASAPYQLHSVDSISSTMNIVGWAREHMVEAVSGLTLVARHQTAGQGQSLESLGAADLKMTVLLKDYPRESLDLARLGFAWATSEAIRIAAAKQGVGTPFEVGIKWPNDVRVLANGQSLKIAGILYLTPSQNPEDWALTERFGWSCPRGTSLLGIGVGLARPNVDRTVSTHLGPKKLSEISTTLDQFTTRPAMWSDLVVPLLTKLALVESLLAAGELDKLANIVARRLALGPDQQIQLERRSQPAEVVSFVKLTERELIVKANGTHQKIPHGDIVRFSPYGYEGV